MFSNDDDTFSKSAQNSLSWVLPDKYITDRLTIQLIFSLIALLSLFLPSTNTPLFKKYNALLLLMSNNSSMNRILLSNSTYVQFSCVKYIPLPLPNLARLQTEKFLVLSTKSWNDTNMCSKFTIFLDDKIRATVQLITYTVPQNCLSIIPNSPSKQFFLCPMRLRGWASDFFLEGRHLSKIRLGANVTTWKRWYLSLVFCCRVLFLSSFHGRSWLIKVNDFFTLSFPHLFQIRYCSNVSTYNNF